VTHDWLAVSARAVAIPVTTDETIGVSDQALLAGVHVPKGRHFDLVMALGGGQSSRAGYLATPTREAMFEAGAQLNVTYRLVGAGLDVLVGAGRSRRYIATGLSLSFGWLQ
jgi:hypothetical protein